MADINTLHQDLQDLIRAIGKMGGGTGSAAGPSGSSPGTARKQTMSDKLSGMTARYAGRGEVGQMFGGGAGIQSMGKMAGPIAATVQLGVELAKLPHKIRDFADNLHEANRAFSSISPSMSLVMMQSDIQDMFRKMRQGEQLAGSAASLAQARGRLHDALQPVDTAWQQLKNRGTALAGNVVTSLLESSGFAKQLERGLNELSGAIKDVNDKIAGPEKEPEDIWLKDLEELVNKEDEKRDMRMRPVRHHGNQDPRPDFPHDRRNGGGV